MDVEHPDPALTDEVMDFLLSAPSLEEIVAMRHSPSARERIRYLLDGNRSESLSDAERAELEAHLQVEYFVRRLKIRAQEQIAKDT